jgi:hypothetical protein
MKAILYGSDGSRVRASRSRPEPNSETELAIREKLKAMDELLDIMWFPHAAMDERSGELEGRYALVCKWPQGDGRWELYQKGQNELPYDIFGWFTSDMDVNSPAVSPDAIENMVLEKLHQCDDQRISHGKRMGQILEKNRKLREDRKKDIVDQAGQIARDLHYMSGHNEEVTMDRIRREIIEEARKNG